MTADAAYRAILVPQQATLTVTVATGDGKSRSKTLSSAQLESGKRYDMSVVVTNIDIDVELSGEVVDWGDGGSLDGSGEGGGGDGGGGEGGGEGGDPGTLSYGGVDYPTATIGGRVWMTRNLRYLPDGAQIGTGIWYPCRGTAGSNDAEYVAERGCFTASQRPWAVRRLHPAPRCRGFVRRAGMSPRAPRSNRCSPAPNTMPPCSVAPGCGIRRRGVILLKPKAI